MPKPAPQNPLRTTTRIPRNRTTVNELAATLEVSLAISNPKGKQKATPEPISTDDARISSMRSVNSALHNLSSIAASGWKTSVEETRKKSPSQTTVLNSISSANKALKKLRQICPQDLDVERAASSIIGKLITLEMFDASLSMLAGMQPRLNLLCEILSPNQSKIEPSQAPFHLTSLQPPRLGAPSMDTTSLTLISTYLLHALIAVTHHAFASQQLDTLTSTLSTSPTLLTWMPYLKSLPEKHNDVLLTRAYTVLTKTSSANVTASSRSIFLLRVYCLRCLLCASSGTVQSSTFWDQTQKFSTVLVRSLSPTSSNLEIDAAGLISNAIEQIVQTAITHQPAFLQCKSFVGVCEFWMGFAKLGGDMKMLDRITDLMQVKPDSSVNALADDLGGIKISPSDDDLSANRDAILRESAMICAILVKTTAAMDEQTDITERGKAALSVLARYSSVRSHANANMEDNDLQRAIGKLDRALERLRRAAVRRLDGNSPADSTIANVLEGVANILWRSIEERPNPDLITAVVDAYFVLARQCDDPDRSLSFLIRATDIVEASLSAKEQPVSERSLGISPTTQANYIRCISGAYHNLAGTLYQSGKYGTAIRFLEEGCRLGARALTLRSCTAALGTPEVPKKEDEEPGNETARENSDRTREKEGWRQLEEQLYRRWELLGVCHSKIGNRRPAYDAFLESIKSFPYAHADAFNPNAQPFNATPGLKQLGTIVDRMTIVGACELFLGPKTISLRNHLRPVLKDNAHIPWIGKLLERQIESLEISMRKEGVRDVIEGLLEDLLEAYEVAQMPVRRAKALLRCVEFVWKSGEIIAGKWDGQVLAQEVLDLLTVKDLAQDCVLAPYLPQYAVAAHFWFSLLAYRKGDVQGASRVAYHAEEGCKILKSITHPPSSTVDSIPKKPAPSKKAPKQITVSKRPTAVRQTKRTVAKPPVTPGPKKASQSHANDPQSTAPAIGGEVKKVLSTVENVESLIELLQMNSYTLGLLGMVLIKLQILEGLKRLCEQQHLTSKDAYIMASIDLAHEYLKLGKTKRAGAMFAKSINVFKSQDISDDIRVRYLLKHAEMLALEDNVLGSASSYCEAMTLSETASTEEKGMSSVERIRTRVGRLERAALAAQVFAAVQHSKDNAVDALKYMMQALRLWNRAVDALARLNPPSNSKASPAEVDDNPFEAPSAESVKGNKDSLARHIPARRLIKDGLEWRMIEGLLGTLFNLTQAYFARGSSREAEYFAQQALDLAESINSPAAIARALTRKAEIQLLQGQLGAGHENILRAAQLLDGMSGVDTADIQRLKGDLLGEEEGARQLYEEATTMLEELEKTFVSWEGGRRKSSLGGLLRSSLPETTQGSVVPTLLSAILRRQIWLLRDESGDVVTNLLDRLIALPPSPEIKGEEHALMGKLALHSVHEQFRTDMFLSSLAESTIALPMGMSSTKDFSSGAAAEILNALDNAEASFWADLVLTSRRGTVPHVREATISLAMICALQTSLGRSGKDSPLLAARLLDASSAITLRRELLEVIEYKFLDPNDFDDLSWPLMTPNGSPLPRPKLVTQNQSRFNRPAFNSGSESDNDEPPPNEPLKSYWDAIRAKHNSQSFDPTDLATTSLETLPRNWTVVNISLTKDKSTMFVCRQRAQSEPLVFCVPLKGRRETEDDEHLAFEDALNELQEIVKLSDLGTRQAVHVKNDDPQARAAWWKDRISLDKQMQELLENIEFCWLGAFKTILSQPVTAPAELITDLRARIDKVFKRSLPPQDRKQKAKLRLDDSILECFSSLSPKCRDEELEDLVYFILDLYQFHGVPVVISEVDVDQVTIDLRSALEEHASKRKVLATPENDSHMFLVLDKNVQGIPWESLPALRGRSVSRIPSIEFLLDRLQLANLQKKSSARATPVTLIDRVTVNPRKTFYALNPSGDLKGTEGRFAPWLKDMHEVGWEGVIGHPPSEQQFLDALARKDLVVYFGHGGGEQYVRSHKIRHLPRCAATMLWGCSSGALKNMGDFDRVGTPYNYMLAGCPALVANLWDVTDRDIDKFSQAVFDELKLTVDGVRNFGVDDGAGTSLVAAVARSRQSCKLKYLTGAAPVVYGIPFYL
ncbi:peptidase family C50-domain-containing protein [Hygrophoropsis aurantiaca]|uniref:Peptidase family C50-domain-containing protein n=1 Tax=Hygrophoropsis aurantiaca TaxID=72124 RepID=A0ACB8AJI4_9AGAM|nr:peptidase family C50-domain-containing protein [Hygrophoropsis aurantiaca]